MTKLDELLARIRLMIPTAKIETDSNHEQILKSHWAAIRCEHCLILVMWHPGHSFRMLVEGDEEQQFNAQYNDLTEDVSDAIDYIVRKIIKRGGLV